MKPSFVHIQRPLLTVMVSELTPQKDMAVIANAIYGGAEAFCIQLEKLAPEYRTLEQLRELFAACQGRPIYVTAYRDGLNDEQCVELLLLGLEAGATSCDVMGDMYHPEKSQMTFDEQAIAKQKALIDLIHARGGEVLMSAHLPDYLDPETVMEYAHAQAARGADVVKIVSWAKDEQQMMTNIQLAHRMKCELDRPFLFLNVGEYGMRLRQIGPSLGVCMYLCQERYLEGRGVGQPLLSSAKKIREGMGI